MKYSLSVKCIISLQLVLLLVKTINVCAIIDEENDERNFIDLYKEGVQAYLSNDFKYCVELIEKSLSKFHLYYDVITTCRLECEFEKQRWKPMYPENIEDLHFYEAAIKKTLCTLKCRKNHLPDESEYFEMDNWAKEKFIARNPYEYLHVCYYRRDELEKAIASAYTFLIANPDATMMQKNLKYYLTQKTADSTMLIDLEEKSFVKYFLSGVDAYDNQNWNDVIDFMEKSLMEYIRNEDECRAFCDSGFDHGWHPDFISSISNHYTFCLRCKINCTQQLSFVRGDYYENIFASHYEYLQIAYYNVDNLEEACRTASSYLLLNPMADDMLENIHFYKKQENVKLSYFTPRNEAKHYSTRQKYEKQLLQFIDTEFNISLDEQSSLRDAEHNFSNQKIILNEFGQCPAVKSDESNEILLKEFYSENQFRLSQANGIFMNDNQFYLAYYPTVEVADLVKEHVTDKKSYQNFMKSEPLIKNFNRVVIDDFITPDECQQLMDILELSAVNGDGYDGNVHPHTDSELFAGLTLARIALLSYFGIFDTNYLKLTLNVTERIKQSVEKYYNINSYENPLYFTYTQFACRQPIDNSGEMAFDDMSMSHAVHADNCVIKKNGSCSYNPPAFSWRDYSAILYLNDNFEGGEFIFASDYYGNEIQSKITPKCGRLVSFSSGPENKHGVKAVRRGQRCALAIWFTHNSSKNEVDHQLAPEILESIEQRGSLHEQIKEQFANK